MLKHFDSFKIYLLILIFSFSLTINNINNYYIVNLIFYLFVHLILIYLAIYYYRFILYFIFFVIGILFDLTLLDEIGPHLITFMIVILFLNMVNKLLIYLSSFKMSLFIVMILCLSILLEKIFSYLLFHYIINLYDILENFLVSLVIFYPSFYLFRKIDKFR